MAQKTTIRNLGTYRHLDPAAFGLDWPELAPLFEGHERLADQGRVVRAEVAELQREIWSEEQRLPGKKARAAREGSKVRTDLPELRAKLKDAEDRMASLEGAAALVEQDIQRELELQQQKYLAQVEAIRERALMRRYELNRPMLIPEWELSAVERLTDYLTKTTFDRTHRFMGLGSRPEVPEEVQDHAGT